MSSHIEANRSQSGIMPKCALLIPAYKPSSGLTELIRALLDQDPAGRISYILVVDDGSGDQYRQTFEESAKLPRVRIIRHAVNLGKGAALKSGFNELLTQYADVQTVITADADGQHAPEDILQVTDEAMRAPKALILGTRTFGKTVPLRSLVGNLFTRGVFRVFTGVAVRDTQTGLRAWPRSMCESALKISASGYDFEMECLVRTKQALGDAFQVREVPIRTIYLDDNSSSHFNPIRDSMRVYFVFLRYCGASLATTAADYLVFILAFSALGSVGWSQILARSVAIFVSFILARNLVFRSDSNWRLSFLRFLSLVIVMGLVSYGLIQWLHIYLGLGVIVAKMLAEGLLFLGNFAIQREFIFNRNEN